MTTAEDDAGFTPDMLDVSVEIPSGLSRVWAQGLRNLEPWQLLAREEISARLAGLRQRYSTRYVPFARRGDCDDLACLDPALPAQVVIVHDFASDGWERRRVHASFWDWFRAAVDDMIDCDP